METKSKIGHLAVECDARGLLVGVIMVRPVRLMDAMI
jgi:hypothetical protein